MGEVTYFEGLGLVGVLFLLRKQSDRAAHAGSAKTTIAARILMQVLLMVFLVIVKS